MTAPETRGQGERRGLAAPEAREKREKGADRVSAASGRSAARRWWVPLAKLLLTATVTWLILRGAGIGLAEAWTVDWTLVQLRAAPLALSVALLAATFVIAAALWSRILAAFGESRIGVGEGAAILLIANLGRYLPGKIAQLAGVAVLARRRGLSAVRATAAAVTAQIMNLLGAAAVGGWVALHSAEVTEGWSPVCGFAIAAGLVAFLYFGGAGVLLRWIVRRSGHTGELPHPDGRRLLLLLPGYVLNWFVYGAAFVLLGRGLGLELGLRAGTTAFAAAYFAGYVALFAPAGIGVREGALAAFAAASLGPEAGVVLAALQRVWITAVELAGAAAGAFLLRGPAARAPTAEARLDAGHPAAGGSP